MSETEVEVESTADPMNGTGAGLLAFLDYVAKNHYMREATVGALKTATKKVLEVEPRSGELEIRHVDLDDLMLRFRTRHRGRLKDASVNVYEQRCRQAIDMYLKWLDQDKDWRPTRTRAVSPGSTGGVKKAARTKAPFAPTPFLPHPPSVDTEERGAGGPSMITYPFPIRRGLQGKITLPEDLTAREASRIAAFVATLVSEEGEGEEA